MIRETVHPCANMKPFAALATLAIILLMVRVYYLELQAAQRIDNSQARTIVRHSRCGFGCHQLAARDDIKARICMAVQARVFLCLMKTVHRRKLTKDFTVLPNQLLRDETLSYRARGILAAMLSHSEEWEVSMAWISARGREGREAVRASVRELEASGYLSVVKEHQKNGKFRWIMTWHDAPIPMPERTAHHVRQTVDGKRPPSEGPLKKGRKFRFPKHFPEIPGVTDVP